MQLITLKEWRRITTVDSRSLKAALESETGVQAPTLAAVLSLCGNVPCC